MWRQTKVVLFFWISLGLKPWTVDSTLCTIDQQILKEKIRKHTDTNTEHQRNLAHQQSRTGRVSSTCIASSLTRNYPVPFFNSDSSAGHKHVFQFTAIHKCLSMTSNVTDNFIEEVREPTSLSEAATHYHTIVDSRILDKYCRLKYQRSLNSMNSNISQNSSGILNLVGFISDLKQIFQDSADAKLTNCSSFLSDCLKLRLFNLEELTSASVYDDKDITQHACLIRNLVHTNKVKNSEDFLSSLELLNFSNTLSPLCDKWINNAQKNSVSTSKYGTVNDTLYHKPINKARTHTVINITTPSENVADTSSPKSCSNTSTATKNKTHKATIKSHFNHQTLKVQIKPFDKHVTVAHVTSSTSILKLVPVIVAGPKDMVEIYALLDDGSSVTLIDQEVVNFIGAQGPKGLIKVSGVSGLVKTSEVSYVTIGIKGKFCNSNFTLRGVQSIPNLGIVNQTIRSEDLAKYPHLRDLASEISYIEAKPRLVIGIDNWHLSLPREVRRGTKDQPVAIKTALGWTVFGQLIEKFSMSEYLFKIIPVTVTGPKESMDIYALIDEGSTVSMIEQDIANVIGAEGPQTLINIQGVGGLTKDMEVSFVTIDVQGKYSNESYTLEGVQSVPNLGIASQTVRLEDLLYFPYLTNITTELSYENAAPTLIIGIDNWHLTLAREVRRGSRNQPIAVRTALGWTVFGKLSTGEKLTPRAKAAAQMKHPLLGLPTI